MLFQNLGVMQGRTVQWLPRQPYLGIEGSSYAQGVHAGADNSSFWDQRNPQYSPSSTLPFVQEEAVDIVSTDRQPVRQEDGCTAPAEQEGCVTVTLPPLDEDPLRGIYYPTFPVGPASIQKPLGDSLEGNETGDLASGVSEEHLWNELGEEEASSSDESYTTNTRKRKAGKGAQQSSKQRVRSEKSSEGNKKNLEWKGNVLAGLIQAVEESTDITQPEESRIDWQLVAAKMSVIAEREMDPVNCRHAYYRKCNFNKGNSREKRDLKGLFKNETFKQKFIQWTQRYQDEKGRILWMKVAEYANRELGQAGGIQLKTKDCRDLYSRQLNPALGPLTQEIQQAIQINLQKGEFRNTDGSIQYAELGHHHHVADHVIRQWVLHSHELDKDPFFQQLRQQEHERIVNKSIEKILSKKGKDR
jgi:hypothetical protein